MRTLFLFLTTILFLTNCKNQNTSALATEAAVESVPLSEAKQADVENKENAEPTKIIKTGNITLSVKDVNSKKKILDKLLEKYNAYYQSDVYLSDNYHKTYNTTIRIPNQNFDAFADDVLKIEGEISNRDIRSEEVTEEYYDTSIRLASKKKNLQRYYDFLSKAKTIKDLIEIEAQIQSVTNDIESLEGRIKLLDNRISFSTLNIVLIERFEFYAAEHQQNTFIKIWNSFKMGFDMLLELFLFFIRIWPIYILGYLLYRTYKWKYLYRAKG
jgi:hypothetical protein